MALRTGGGLQNETPLPISGDRLHDMNEVVLQRAIEAVYPLDAMASYADAYRLAGGTGDFTDYYTARYGHAIINH